jgi:hypothetical protein
MAGAQNADLLWLHMTGNAITFLLYLLSYASFISEHDCTPLQSFYKDCTQSNQQLALSQFM